MRKKYSPAPVESFTADPNTTLPTSQPIAIYYRQSTEAQIGNVSTTLQTVDMASYLHAKGWKEEDIIMIDMDGGVSGMKKIDERPGMKALFDLITEGKIRAVACQDEDRLFRDVTQIQVNIFIETCRMAHVLVITPSMIYDFAHEGMGTFHARQFRFKSEMAAEYIKSYVIGRLNRARNHLMMEGKWVGVPMYPGYMADMRKRLPDGQLNDQFRRFTPFLPYAEVVAEYFRLFVYEFAGNLRATLRHIHAHGPYYPDPANSPPPEGFAVNYRRMQRYGNGYCPGRTGLSFLLTNAIYLGHWIVGKTIVRYNNHPAIVPADLFMQAFNFLSPVTLDGSPNPHYTPFFEHARPTREEDRPTERPLLSGMIIAEVDGVVKTVGTNWSSSLKRYDYTLWGNGNSPNEEMYVWSKVAHFVDDKVVSLLRAKLESTFRQDVWEATYAHFLKTYEKERKRMQAQLTALKTVMTNQTASLDTLTNSELIKTVEKRYIEAQAECTRLERELAERETEAAQMDSVYGLKERYSPALDEWVNMTRDEQRGVLHAFIHHIEANAVEDGAGLMLIVYWKDNTQISFTLPRQAANGTRWLPSETARLLALVDAGACQLEIARAFPERTWRLIYNKVYYERGKGVLTLSAGPIDQQENFIMYCQRVGMNPDLESLGFDSEH